MAHDDSRPEQPRAPSTARHPTRRTQPGHPPRRCPSASRRTVAPPASMRPFPLSAERGDLNEPHETSCPVMPFGRSCVASSAPRRLRVRRLNSLRPRGSDHSAASWLLDCALVMAAFRSSSPRLISRHCRRERLALVSRSRASYILVNGDQKGRAPEDRRSGWRRASSC